MAKKKKKGDKPHPSRGRLFLKKVLLGSELPTEEDLAELDAGSVEFRGGHVLVDGTLMGVPDERRVTGAEIWGD